MNLLLILLPAIFGTGEKILGSLFTNASHSSVAGSVIASFTQNPTVDGIVQGIEGAVGSIEDQKKLQLQAELQTLLAQTKLNSQVLNSNNFFFAGARPTLFWGLIIALLMSVLVEPTIDYILGFFGIKGPTPFVLSPIVISMLSSLCGIFMIGRSVEKINGVYGDH